MVWWAEAGSRIEHTGNSGNPASLDFLKILNLNCLFGLFKNLELELGFIPLSQFTFHFVWKFVFQLTFVWLCRIARDRAVRSEVYYSTADWTLLVTWDNLILQCSNTPSLYFSLSYVPRGFLWRWHIEGSRNEKRQAEQITKQSRQDKTSGVPGAQTYGFWNSFFYLSPMAESPVWKTIDCASWLLGGWRWRAGKWHLQRRCQDPESWSRAAPPPSSIQHQTELTSQPGAPEPPSAAMATVE